MRIVCGDKAEKDLLYEVIEMGWSEGACTERERDHWLNQLEGKIHVFREIVSPIPPSTCRRELIVKCRACGQMFTKPDDGETASHECEAIAACSKPGAGSKLLKRFPSGFCTTGRVGGYCDIVGEVRHEAPSSE